MLLLCTITAERSTAFLFIIPYFGPVGAGEFLVIVYEF